MGKAIRELRSKQDISLRSFAPLTGITVNTLSLIERGQANPTWETVKQIAAALGVPISTLAKAAERFES